MKSKLFKLHRNQNEIERELWDSTENSNRLEENKFYSLEDLEGFMNEYLQNCVFQLKKNSSDDSISMTTETQLMRHKYIHIHKSNYKIYDQSNTIY